MTPAPTVRIGKAGELALYVALTASLGAAYLVVSFVLPLQGDQGLVWQNTWFGFSQLRWAGAPLTLAILALVILRARRTQAPLEAVSSETQSREASVATTSRIRHAGSRLALALVACTAFLLLRNEFLNTDGQMLLGKFTRAVRTDVTPVTHDEMWELYLHSRYWIVAHEWWGWGVRLTYQVLSCVAGGLFVLLLFEYWELALPSRRWAVFWSSLAGGYMQLFFGDVENYTLTTCLMMAYFLSSLLFLRGRVRIWQPTVLLGIAMTFHLVAGFLTPSLAYLWWVAWRTGHRLALGIAVGAFSVTLASTLAFFHGSGLPISDLFTQSHAFGHGGHFEQMLVRPSLPYYRDLLNLVLLLTPSILLLIPLVLYRCIALHRENMHLALAAGFMMFFVLTWKAQIGVYQDWNLFAVAALPISLLVWRNVPDFRGTRMTLRPIPVLTALALTHSLAWIVGNHFSR